MKLEDFLKTFTHANITFHKDDKDCEIKTDYFLFSLEFVKKVKEEDLNKLKRLNRSYRDVSLSVVDNKFNVVIINYRNYKDKINNSYQSFNDLFVFLLNNEEEFLNIVIKNKNHKILIKKNMFSSAENIPQKFMEKLKTLNQFTNIKLFDYDSGLVKKIQLDNENFTRDIILPKNSKFNRFESPQVLKCLDNIIKEYKGKKEAAENLEDKKVS